MPFSSLNGLPKEHRIPLRNIRFMTKDCYQELRKAWMGSWPVLSYAVDQIATESVVP